jgi:hypothetical protein
MQPTFYEFMPGDRTEHFLSFTVHEVKAFHNFIYVSHLEDEALEVDCQMIAAKVFALAINWSALYQLKPVQQEMIFLTPVRIQDELKVLLKIVEIEESRSWITLAIEALDVKGTKVLRGQAVMAYQKL